MDKATEQMHKYKADQEKSGAKQNLTSQAGAPIGDAVNSMTVGPRGPIVLQDNQLVEELAAFSQERIPERVVHAKGAGAYGYFEVTKPDIKKYCRAKMFESVGKRTPLVVRFSTVGGEVGSADTVRDPRGFAVKFKTEEGNWDMTGNNTPIFFIRDPILFPSFIHTQKRNPQTHLKDPDLFWDFISLRPETLHQVSFLFSDRGIPDGYRHMNGYGSHTFKLVNDKNEAVYCKFHFKTCQGIKNLPADKATGLVAADPDYSIRDLYNSIAEGKFPAWTLSIQVMTFAQAEKCRFNPFDLTKVWPQSEYPLIEVGRMVLNENPKNYFAEVEQSAFAPSNLIPGIEASPDKMLQARLFAYPETHRHRLGPNFEKIPVNKAVCPVFHPTRRDGPYCYDDNHGGTPNYWPSSFLPQGLTQAARYKEHAYPASGDVDRHESGNEDNTSQVAVFYNKVLTEEQRERLVQNIAGHLKGASGFIQERALKNFSAVDKSYGDRIRAALRAAGAKL